MEETRRTKQAIRIWQYVDLEQIRKHLLLVDDLYGTCGNCKQIGLNYTKDTSCSKCKTEFHYLATNQKKLADIAKILKRIQSSNLNLIVIDRSDFEHSSAKLSAQLLFR